MKKLIAILSIGLLTSFSLFADIQTMVLHPENTHLTRNSPAVKNFQMSEWQVSLADRTVYYDTPSKNQVIVDETWQNQYGLEWHQVYQISEDDYFHAGNKKSLKLYKYLQAYSK